MVMAGRHTLSKDQIPRACTRRWPRPWSSAFRNQGSTSRKRRTGVATRPRWPMIVLRSPKGWGARGSRWTQARRLRRAHQVPLADVKKNPEHLQILEKWMRAQKPEELFDRNGKLIPELKVGASRQPPHERQSARERRNSQESSAVARLHAIMLSRSKSPGKIEAENTPASGKRFCAT